ncbi:MAG: hypothetical protein CFE24_01355 [Flavobacterium sp. BFFFF2]|nr:MAG: hypothetical protein CFE24_01355 [Flavobacterium sp. BFFFF2]
MKCFFIFLISGLLHSQMQTASVQYSLSFIDNLDLEKDEVLGGYYKKAKAEANQMGFTLQIDHHKMLFFKNEGLSIAKSSFADAFCDAVGVFYYENGGLEILNDIDDKHIGRYIIKLKGQFQWKLHNEQKKIDHYNCLKATSEIKNGDKTTLVTAWYCPQIPVSFGPKGYNGLPGLILELHEGDVVFGANKVALNHLDKAIQKPTGAPLLTEKEYNDLIQKMTSDKN